MIVKLPKLIWSTVWFADVIQLNRFPGNLSLNAFFWGEDITEESRGLMAAALGTALRSELFVGVGQTEPTSQQFQSAYEIAFRSTESLMCLPLTQPTGWLESVFMLFRDMAPTTDPIKFIPALMTIAVVDSCPTEEVLEAQCTIV